MRIETPGVKPDGGRALSFPSAPAEHDQGDRVHEEAESQSRQEEERDRHAEAAAASAVSRMTPIPVARRNVASTEEAVFWQRNSVFQAYRCSGR